MMIKITVNGETIETPNFIKTITDLVTHLNLTERRFFIIEKNREVIQKELYDNTSVNNGDQFEIVHFVGGG